MGKHVDDAEFVATFMMADSILDVANKFNMSVNSVSVKAKRLRAIGVELPRFKRKPVEVDKLNEIINKV
jgi:hypothetical protein